MEKTSAFVLQLETDCIICAATFENRSGVGSQPNFTK